MLKFHARTDVGLKRKHNEDSLLAAEEFGVFVVADGVGGRKAGELASAITVNTFQSYAPQLKAAVDAFASDSNRETRNGVQCRARRALVLRILLLLLFALRRGRLRRRLLLLL